MLLFLLASGLTVIFSMMGVLNFAHASFYMLGAYFGFQISQYFGFWTGLILAPVLVGLIGALVERFGLRTVHKWGHVPELLFTRSEEHTSELQSLMRSSYAVFCLETKRHIFQSVLSFATAARGHLESAY